MTMTMAAQPSTTTSDATARSTEGFDGVRLWELTERERSIYEQGVIAGWVLRQGEVDAVNYEADRLYVAAFDHRHCSCWKQRRHNVTW